jgi:hypothetical protein
VSLSESVLVGLAAWRIAVLLVNEDGPWDLAERLRDLAGVNKPGPMRGISKLLTCVWCTSFWTALIMAAIFLWVWAPPVELVSVAGVALLLERSVSAQES